VKILITGHQGFIGSGLWNRLFLLEDVQGIDLKSGKDILTAELPEVDLVVHLAARAGVRESVKDPKKYWETNVEGTKRILEHYKDIRVLVASSSSVYEPHLNPYSATKFITESIPHPNCCFMRFHTVYNESARTGMFFDKLFKGSVEYITEHERDFIHLEDMLDALHSLIYNPQVKGTFDIGTGKTVNMRHICPNLPVKTDTPRERQKTQADTTFMKENCGWEAKRKVEDFLEEHFESIRNYYNG
jgi:nucleoside-diphosphate-sugar epimerase